LSDVHVDSTVVSRSTVGGRITNEEKSRIVFFTSTANGTRNVSLSQITDPFLHSDSASEAVRKEDRKKESEREREKKSVREGKEAEIRSLIVLWRSANKTRLLKRLGHYKSLHHGNCNAQIFPSNASIIKILL